MSYPDPDRTFGEEARFLGEGFRVEPDFRQETGEPEYVPDPTDRYAPLALEAAPRHAVTAAELDDVFDDPEHGEPGRDRLGVHWMWETILLLAGTGVGFAVVNGRSGVLDGPHIRNLMIIATVLGLTALGAGLTLRAGAVNLAIGPTMVVAGLYFADHNRDGFFGAAGVALLIALGLGVGIAVVVVGLHVPGWLASLGAFFGIQIWIAHMPAIAVLTTRYHPAHQGYYWFGGFAFLAVVGGILGAIRPIRRSLGRFRSIADPADRRGAPAAVLTGLAIVASSLLAGLAGIALSMQNGQFVSQDGLTVSGAAVGVALLAGTSAYGRRGGIFGTVLATGLFVLVGYYATLAKLDIDPMALIAGAIGIGLVVTRLVETAGRPQRGIDPAADSAANWLGRQQGSWANQLPARPDDDEWTDPGEERWGTR